MTHLCSDILPAAEFGLPADEPPAVGVKAAELLLDFEKRTSIAHRGLDLHDLERLRDERKAALGRGAPFEAELRARQKDGEYRWFLIRYNPFRNEQGQLTRWYATGTDIDDRVRAEEMTRTKIWHCESRSIVTGCSKTTCERC
jgi:PAS domain-containing protein